MGVEDYHMRAKWEDLVDWRRRKTEYFDFEHETAKLLTAYRGLAGPESANLAEFFEQRASEAEPLSAAELTIMRFVSYFSLQFCGHMKQAPPYCDLGMYSWIAFSPERVKAIASELGGLDLELFMVRYRRFADVPLHPDGFAMRWPAEKCETYFRQVVPFWCEAASRGLGILYARN